MPHQIDWTNARGAREIERRVGPRHSTLMPLIGPIIFKVMESIGQFKLPTIERELRSHGWEMKSHATVMRDIKSVIWFVNASDQSGYWFNQLRVIRSNNFIWRVENCGLMQKELYWRASAIHAQRSIPKKTAESTEFEVIIEPLFDDGPAEIEAPGQSISLEELDITKL